MNSHDPSRSAIQSIKSITYRVYSAAVHHNVRLRYAHIGEQAGDNPMAFAVFNDCANLSQIGNANWFALGPGASMPSLLDGFPSSAYAFKMIGGCDGACFNDSIQLGEPSDVQRSRDTRAVLAVCGVRFCTFDSGHDGGHVTGNVREHGANAEIRDRASRHGDGSTGAGQLFD